MTRRDQRGFTLIEVVVVVTLMGIIFGAIGASLIVVVRTIGGTSDRMAQSHDAQLLSLRLVADIQSATNPGGITRTLPSPLPSMPDGTCDSGSEPFTVLDLNWTDTETSVTYRALYEIDTARWEMRRTFTENGVVKDSFIVVHNLENPSVAQPRPVGATPRYPACITITSIASDPTMSGKVSVTITTLVNANGSRGSYQFPFTVGTQTRQPYQPPLPLDEAAPESQDVNPADGRADTIVVKFDQPVTCAPPTGPPPPAGSCPLAGWEITGHPGYLPGDVISPAYVAITSADRKEVKLTLQPTPIDTSAAAMELRLKAGSLNGAGGPALISKKAVVDGMNPILIPTAQSADVSGDGTLDHVTVEFSELLSGPPDLDAFNIVGGPDGGEEPSVGVAPTGTSGREYLVEFATSTFNTVAAGAKLRLDGGLATAGLLSNLPTLIGIADGMAPVLTGLPITTDIDIDGLADRVEMAFSEPLRSMVTAGQWVLDAGPSGVSAVSLPTVLAPSTVRLDLTEGGGAPKTSTDGFLLRLNGNANGVQDTAGNPATFGSTATVDAMKPVVVSVATASIIGGTVGKPEAGDTITVTFSEDLAAVTLPITMTLKRVNGNSEFELPGIVRLTTNTNSYSTKAVTCTMTVTQGARTFTGSVSPVGCAVAADLNVGASSTVTATPGPVKDLVDLIAGGTRSFTGVLF